MKKTITAAALIIMGAGFIAVFSESDYALGVTALAKIAGFAAMYGGYKLLLKAKPELND